MAYLLDADVLISASNKHYSFDFCPAFWDWLIESNRDGQVYSIEKVYDEIIGKGDELTDWVKQRDTGFFLKPDQNVLSALSRVSNWASAQDYYQAAVHIFLSAADCYLVAHALAHGHTVVTHEQPADSRRKIKIPNACRALGITCMTPFKMLRRERPRFVLGASP